MTPVETDPVIDPATNPVQAKSIPTNPTQTAWQANLKVNQLLLEHLTPELLSARTPGGGFSVAQHLAHIVSVTKYRGAQLDERLETLPDLFTLWKDVAEEDIEGFVPEIDLERIKAVLTQTAGAVQEAAAEGTTGTSPYPSADAYLIHMMVHDAHHRGQILLALKTSGCTLPDEDAMWLPWKE